MPTPGVVASASIDSGPTAVAASLAAEPCAGSPAPTLGGGETVCRVYMPSLIVPERFHLRPSLLRAFCWLQLMNSHGLVV